MSEAYREKLMRWFTSMLLLGLGTALYTLILWFNKFLNVWGGPDWSHAYFFAFAAVFYFSVFPPVLLWHVGDFILLKPFQNRWLRIFLKYEIMIGIIVWLSAIAIVVELGVLDDLFCPRNVQYGFDGCGSWTPDWLVWTHGLSLLTLAIVALTKLIASIAQYLPNYGSAAR